MLLTITTTHTPATDLGYLLMKNPARVQSFNLSFGKAHIFYPEATAERCTVALLVDVDPIELVRGQPGSRGDGRTLEHYVNDRPYSASSFLSVALAEVFGTALGGRSKDRPDLAQIPIPLQATVAALRCRSGEGLLRRLFEPLGYAVTVQGYPLDHRFPAWGQSDLFTLTLTGTCRLSELLTHLYVLVPVLDKEKHYWVGEDEVEKLLRRSADWLPAHPERDLIVQRYLKYQRRLTDQALARLLEEQPDTDDDAAEAPEVEAVEVPLRLHEQRLGAVVAVLRASGARRVLDLGCGEGRLLEVLLKDKAFEEIVGMDVAYRSLEIARDRLRLDRLPPAQAQRLTLIHGSLIYRDQRLAGYDAAAVVEVVEHLDPDRLAAFEHVVFEFARPGTVVLTTPNVEYNVKFPTLPAGTLRHRDHRFEWTREEFQSWAGAVATRFGYHVRFVPVGPEDPDLGPPTQMGVFTRDA